MKRDRLEHVLTMETGEDLQDQEKKKLKGQVKKGKESTKRTAKRPAKSPEVGGNPF